MAVDIRWERSPCFVTSSRPSTSSGYIRGGPAQAQHPHSGHEALQHAHPNGAKKQPITTSNLLVVGIMLSQ